MKRMWIILCLAAELCVFSHAQARRHHLPRIFQATAYAQHGTTKSGLHTQTGVVAADPEVLPLGTRISVTNAGEYSGVYTVADTGAKVQGHHIDIFMPSRRLAKIFGRKKVLVTVLRWGDWETPHS